MKSRVARISLLYSAADGLGFSRWGLADWGLADWGLAI